jgi:hypothetical protein
VEAVEQCEVGRHPRRTFLQGLAGVCTLGSVACLLGKVATERVQVCERLRGEQRKLGHAACSADLIRPVKNSVSCAPDIVV